MKMSSLIGNYLGLYIGYSCDKKIRQNGTSGGIITAILMYLVSHKKVDGVITVGFYKKIFPKVKIFTTRKQLINESPGSKYVKFNIDDYLSIINKNRGKRLVIVAHPCIVLALRKIFKSEEFFYIEHFCGWPMSFKATERVVNNLGLSIEEIAEISYRHGDFPGGLRLKTKKGATYRFPKDLYNILNPLYLPEPCFNCRFYSGEWADVSVGDCWIKNKKKYSTVIIRTSSGIKLMTKLRDCKVIKLEVVSEKDIQKTHSFHLRFKKSGNKKISKFIIKEIQKIRDKIPILMLYKITPFFKKLLNLAYNIRLTSFLKKQHRDD